MIRSLRLLRPLVLAITLVGAVGATESDAHALGGIDLEVGVKAGAGTNPDSKGPNPFGFGLGARGGIGLGSLWLGVSGIHYFGGSLDLPAPLSTKVDYSSSLIGGELGYTIKAIPFLDIRPQLGVGDAIFTASEGSVSTSKGKLYLEPGLTVLVPLGLLFVGADANVLVIPDVDPAEGGSSKTFTSFTIHGQIGIRL